MQSRSRLKKNQVSQVQEQDTVPLGKIQRTSNSKNLPSQYIQHIPLLLLSVIFFFWCVQVFTTKQPQDIANFLLYQAYLQLLIPFFLFVTFLTGYLTLNIRRGSVMGLFATLLLLFRLQQIEFTTLWLFLILVLFTTGWIATKKQKS